MSTFIDQFPTLQAFLRDSGQPAYRARQIREWVVRKRAGQFGEMTDLPAELRRQLEDRFTVLGSDVARGQQAPDGTEKLLLRLADGAHVECVLLRDHQRRTICVSSQVGCAMGCVFCASGLSGVERNLTAGEIVEQMLQLDRRLPDAERLSHIVMMGMGEPLANLDAVLGALEVARDERGLGISPRRITISTVGIPAAIDRLAGHGSPFNLAISLHAPNDRLRSQLVPVNRRVGLSALLQAADRYFEACRRRLTFEYVLLAGINDTSEHAEQLGSLLQGRSAWLNVIPYNPVAGLPYRTPSAKVVENFRHVLVKRGIEVNFRQRKGSPINAACGQLRRQVASPSPPPAHADPSGSA